MQKQVSEISFLLNNEKIHIDFTQQKDITPTTTVLEWLRMKDEYSGVKEGCAEGDCGACTVVIADAIEGKLVYRSVTSCILFLPYLNGKQLITVEHLSNKINGDYQLHAVQEVLAKHNGSQCGYCTPGIVMSLFSFQKNQETVEDIPFSLSGNLCRCTGYESIRQAAVEIVHLPKIQDQFQSGEFEVIKLLEEMEQTHESFSVENYYQAHTLEEALSYKKEHPDAILLGGASDIALLKTKKHQDLAAILDLSRVAEMNKIEKYDTYWEIGASVTIEQLRKALSTQWPDFKNVLDVFGSKQIRNVATLGGNIGSASPIGDLLPLLMTHQAEIIIRSKHEVRTEQLEEFIMAYRTTTLMPDELICKVIMPIDTNWIFWAEKVSKRKQLDISTVSAAFAVRLTEDHKVSAVVLAYGGMAAMPKRADMAEAYLLGKPFEESAIVQAAKLVKEEFLPLSDARATKEGRSLIASNLLLKFFYAVA